MMRPCFALLFFFLIATTGIATERGQVKRNIAYSEAGGVRTQLDVYSPADARNLPVVIWVHGGGWQIGSKASVQDKPKAFNEKGYVFVSVNYRFHPAVTYKEQAGDIAQAVRWVRDHAAEHGGDSKQIFLMGHSAGAHLVALVGTDGRYLENAGLKLSNLSGVILLDGAGYDIPRQIRQSLLPRSRALYTEVFTEDLATRKDASPVTHIASGKNIPPFLILHVADRRDAKAQSEALGSKLRSAGVEVTVVPAEGKTHATINKELGQSNDAPTKAVFEFLESQSRQPQI